MVDQEVKESLKERIDAYLFHPDFKQLKLFIKDIESICDKYKPYISTDHKNNNTSYLLEEGELETTWLVDTPITSNVDDLIQLQNWLQEDDIHDPNNNHKDMTINSCNCTCTCIIKKMKMSKLPQNKCIPKYNQFSVKRSKNEMLKMNKTFGMINFKSKLPLKKHLNRKSSSKVKVLDCSNNNEYFSKDEILLKESLNVSKVISESCNQS